MRTVGRFAIALVFVWCSFALADQSHRFMADVFVEGKKTFVMKSAVTTQGKTVTRTSDFYDVSDTKILSVSTQFTTEPLKIISMDLEDFRTGRKETIEQQGKSYLLSSRTETGESTDKDLVDPDEVEPLMNGYMIGTYIRQNLQALVSGTELEFELAVPSRQESVGFDLEYTGTESKQGQDCYVMRMEASSWIIRQLVDPLYFYIQKSAPHRILEFQGRLTPTDDKGDALVGTMVYSY